MIYVARHGQTQYNVDGKICGHADIELTEVGYAQAEELAQLVSDLEQPITKIYVSPLRRAQETARIINEKVSVPIEVEPRLIEMDFG
ncbi:Adenosylcobalamin/alpha-ribazole phosphatase [Enterococcus faecalis]|nr:Adenosylcobalamin/alpha-ribazole phosphatase [Enterococcus faecalis]CAC9822287.1 Adenosylcobalamin/alpha-ribazole phosphatase [Enterococcus faecalis]CAC9823523.1 Adenosylcobalamin/alpha-ribazole phosphatase [Enterococcus faecalis]CAC9824319.1 Adenosylcobalamin/alpha-ribazole phosphatase [Enterococcus faecalis]CAC9826551.1 Adenosylcobalamin/alpha-ribazole phosphatase [Enterococcus faecalis]